MKIDRLIGIISILLQSEKVTAPYLAEKFEVSRRTINRDVEDICKAGIPLVTTQGQNGGISILSGYALDKTVLTSQDMSAILTGLKTLDSVSGTKKYQQLMEKLAVGTSSSEKNKSMSSNMVSGSGIYIDLSANKKTSLAPKIELLQNALLNHKKVIFSYYSPNGKSFRTVQPYILIFWWSSWYLWSFCELRNSFRLFKLNRMEDLKETNLVFSPIENPPSVEMSLQNAYPQDEMQIKLKFEPEMKWRVIDEFGEKKFIEDSDKNLIASFSFKGKESLFTWLLTFADKVELLEPKDLRKEFLSMLKDIQKRYE